MSDCGFCKGSSDNPEFDASVMRDMLERSSSNCLSNPSGGASLTLCRHILEGSSSTCTSNGWNLFECVKNHVGAVQANYLEEINRLKAELAMCKSGTGVITEVPGGISEDTLCWPTHYPGAELPNPHMPWMEQSSAFTAPYDGTITQISLVCPDGGGTSTYNWLYGIFRTSSNLGDNTFYGTPTEQYLGEYLWGCGWSTVDVRLMKGDKVTVKLVAADDSGWVGRYDVQQAVLALPAGLDEYGAKKVGSARYWDNKCCKIKFVGNSSIVSGSKNYSRASEMPGRSRI